MEHHMSQATIAALAHVLFKVAIKSALGTRHYITTATSSFEAWENAADYCGDTACGITVTLASAQ
jgi:hypothetical protein